MPDTANLHRAEEAWGLPLPRWIALLAEECDRTSQRAAGAAIARSSGYVSRLVNRSYAGDYAEAEKLVLAAFGDDQVACPVVGAPIPLKTCIRNRRRTGAPAAGRPGAAVAPASWLGHHFARTCPACPNNLDRSDGGPWPTGCGEDA